MKFSKHLQQILFLILLVLSFEAIAQTQKKGSTDFPPIPGLQSGQNDRDITLTTKPWLHYQRITCRAMCQQWVFQMQPIAVWPYQQVTQQPIHQWPVNSSRNVLKAYPERITDEKWEAFSDLVASCNLGGRHEGAWVVNANGRTAMQPDEVCQLRDMNRGESF
jgi:hypothetical protein